MLEIGYIKKTGKNWQCAGWEKSREKALARIASIFGVIRSGDRAVLTAALVGCIGFFPCNYSYCSFLIMVLFDNGTRKMARKNSLIMLLFGDGKRKMARKKQEKNPVVNPTY